MYRISLLVAFLVSSCSSCAHKAPQSTMSVGGTCDHLRALSLANFKASGGVVDEDVLAWNAAYREYCHEYAGRLQKEYPVWFQELSGCIMGSRTLDEAMLCAADFDAKVEAD